MSNVISAVDMKVRSVSRPPTWRDTNYIITYLLPRHEPAADDLIAIHSWAAQVSIENPRVVPPSALVWSSLFHPRFFQAITSEGATTSASEMSLSWTTEYRDLKGLDLTKFWLESVLFLAGVTLGAAIVQSRFSEGTIGSKYDRLWQAAELADCGRVPELKPLNLKDTVRTLSSDNKMSALERLLCIRKLFISSLRQLVMRSGTIVMMRPVKQLDSLAGRFGFVNKLRSECGRDLQALIVYGSSITSAAFADYDVIVVTEKPESFLRKFAGKAPTWRGKELNLGVYSPAELELMQLASGDNLAEYGLCVWGEAPVVHKPVSLLLARNFSFGFVRQRQQLGMLALALESHSSPDIRNLLDYFVKIPANVAKGTLGALGEKLSKEAVLAWMKSQFGFDASEEQRRALSQPAKPLAAAAIATGAVMRSLNERTRLVTVV